MNKSTLSLVTLVGILALGGCASTGNVSIADQTRESVSAQLVRGKSTQDDVRRLYGDPIKSSFTDSGNELWEYNFSKAHEKLQNFIPVVSAFTSGTTGKKKTLVVFFDKSGVVQNYTMSSSDIDTHVGLFQ